MKILLISSPPTLLLIGSALLPCGVACADTPSTSLAAPSTAALLPLTITEPQENVSLDADNTLIVWQEVPGAKAYRITVTGTDAPDAKTVKVDDLVPLTQEGYAAVKMKVGAGNDYSVVVEALKTVNFTYRVTESDVASEVGSTVTTSKDVVFASSVARKFNTRTTFGQRLKAQGVSLQRSFTLQSDPLKNEAATFGYVHKAGATATQNVEFALIYKNPKVGHSRSLPNLEWGSSLEARITTDANKRGDNALRFRLTGETQTGALHNALSLKYEADKDFDAQRLTAELLIAPTIGRLTGQYLPDVVGKSPTGQVALSERPFAQVMFQPYLGVDVGSNLRVGDSAELKSTVLRLVSRNRADVRLNSLARALSLPSVILYADHTLRYLPLEDDRKIRNYFASGIDFSLTKDVSFGLSYKVGRDAPKFQRGESFAANFGVKF